MQQIEERIKNDTLTELIIGAAIQVHRELAWVYKLWNAAWRNLLALSD